MADMFISYARADRERCTKIHEALTALKLDIWFDGGIASGDSFDRKIEEEIDGAKSVMVLWSDTSVQSNWVRNEARTGAERDSLVAVQLEACKLPLEFRSIHTELLPAGAESEASPVWLGLLSRIGDLTDRPGLADYARLSHANADVESWKTWLMANAHDPLAADVLNSIIGAASPEMRQQLAEERAKISVLEAELGELRESSKAHSGAVASTAQDVARMRSERDQAEQAKIAAETELDRLRAGSGLPAKRGFWEGEQSAVGLTLDDRLGAYVGGLLWIFTLYFIYWPASELAGDSAGIRDILLLIIGIVFLAIPTIIVTWKIIQHRRAVSANTAEKQASELEKSED
jgi:hypothetical protein